jgi:hypothetical protein
VRTYLSLLALVLALAPACKSDSQPTTAGGAGGGTAAGIPTAPKRPGKPFDMTTFEEISKLSFGDAATSALESSDDRLALRVVPTGEPPIQSTIRLSRCLNCVAMDKALWEPRLAELRQLLPKEVRDKPDTVFELGEVTIGGEKAIYTYQLAVHAIGGVDGQPLHKALNTHAITIYWNDGVNQAQVVTKDASPPDSPTLEQLAAKVPRDRITKAATDAMATILPYVHGK